MTGQGADSAGTSFPTRADLKNSTTAADLEVSSQTVLALLEIIDELEADRQGQTQLAVAEERLRFSQDVHDILGRRLSAIAVKSELAATLAVRGDDRAAAQMLEVRGVAHEALKEARELARGYRPINLANELEGARLLLRSAGIEVDLDVDVVPGDWHEAAAWVVRESVTNVIRHSTACGVSISFFDGKLSVVNDGAPTDGIDDSEPEDSAGLRGLRERLEPLGATMVAEGHEECWTVVARLPGAGPTRALTTMAGSKPARCAS
jgi:two-component system sensor histidine kinase DesK